MNINKLHLVTGVLFTSTIVLPLADISQVEAASQTLITTGNVNFRKGPSTDYSIIKTLLKGTKLTYIEQNGKWIKATYNGVTGYVSGNYVEFINSTQEQIKYVNSKDGVNVRSGPSTSYTNLGKLPYKQKVTVLSTSDGWSKIKYNGSTAYVYSIYLQDTIPGDTTQVKYVNSTTGLNVRSGPSTSYTILGRLDYKEKVTVLSTSNGWSKIKYNGSTGYVSDSYLQNTIPEDTSQAKYVNSKDGVNVRSGPSTSYKILGRLDYKQKVTVLSTSDGWSKIKYNGSTAYVYSIYLQDTIPGDTTQVKYVNSTTGLNVRSGPSTSYTILGRLDYKEKVTVLSTSNGWSKIKYNGSTGYVSDSYLQNTIPNGNTSTSVSASEIIAYAKQFLGRPYVWGAQGPDSFDCSGFTYYVFKNKAGITLPRTSNVQTLYGKAVSKSNLQPADLVFFDTNGVNDGQVSHVGIYIGNGQIIHASSGQGKIVIANFNSSYFQNTYVNARRVL